MGDFVALIFGSLRYGSYIALAALGIVLIFKTSRTTNFAQASIGTLGAYVAAWLITTFDVFSNIWLSSLTALIFAFLFGIVIDLLVMRRAGRVSPLSKQIITLGFILLIWGMIPIIFGTSGYSIHQAYFTGSTMILGTSVEYQTLFFVGLSIVLMLTILLFIQKTRWGLATRVTASDRVTAKLMGVPTERVTMFSWAVAAVLGTVAGLMVAQSAVRMDMLVIVQVSAFFACIFGGFNTFHGPVIAAFIIAFSRELAYTYFSDTWHDTLIWTVILFVLYFKPEGLFGKKEVRKV